MNRRNVTGILVLAAIAASLLYLWQPWNTSDASPLKLGLDLQGGLRVVLQAEEANPSLEDLNAARNVIENRINAFGVSEPLIQTSANNRIVVELPGLTSADQERALDLIGQQAVLEFRLVSADAQNLATEQMTLEDLEPTAFTGEILQDARADFNRLGGATLGGAVVLFDIKREFADDFGAFTGGNIGRSMAIVLDGNIITAPTLQGRISDSGQITGIGALEEASDIALVLRSGSLPINLQVEEIRAIGPTLGADSVAAGLRAGLLGALGVVVAVMLYFGPLFGGILAFGLVYVMLLTFGALAGLGAVLTLPGLAGLVLTLGSSVDGNVISFERVKEELRAGKGLRLAMRKGFESSLSAIIDANATALLAAAALYQYTSGPVRGFAITWAIGIVASVFVNTVVVPFILDVLTLRFKRPLMPRGFYARGLRILNKAPALMGISLLLAALSLFFFFSRDLNLSTDFTGGTSILLGVAETTNVNDVRAAVDGLESTDVDGGSATVQEVEGGAEKQISVRVGLIESSEASSALAEELAAVVGGSVLQTEFVGPNIGGDLRTGAVLAVSVALGLILLYISWRFWPNWIISFVAVLAVVHDLIIVLGVLVVLGAEFSIPVLAALLSVVGYSLNDKIVLADRIRENLRKARSASYRDTVELSVNETLSRTILTMVTTLIPVLALFFFGGSVLRDFSITLLLGVGLGAYSSTFILAPLLVWFKRWRREGSKLRQRAV